MNTKSFKIKETEGFRETMRLHRLWCAKNPAGVRANFTGVDWTGQDFSGVDLEFVILINAILIDVDFSRAKLNGAILTGATVSLGDITRKLQ